MIAMNKQLAEVLEDMRNGTYDMTDNGVCTQCGACCSNLLPMTDKEIKRIRGYIKKHQVKEYKHLIPAARIVADMTCPFMDDSKQKEKCRIYPVRPEICRQFICDPKKIRVFDSDESFRIVDVRKEFFR